MTTSVTYYKHIGTSTLSLFLSPYVKQRTEQQEGKKTAIQNAGFPIFYCRRIPMVLFNPTVATQLNLYILLLWSASDDILEKCIRLYGHSIIGRYACYYYHYRQNCIHIICQRCIYICIILLLESCCYFLTKTNTRQNNKNVE